MIEGRQHLRICGSCGQEKSRAVIGGIYRYYCHCLAWKEYLAVLEHARDREQRRRPRPRTGARRVFLRLNLEAARIDIG